MALYSSSLQTALIDDTSFNQSKCEFRLQPDTMYYSNLRLINLGLSGTAQTYHPLSGVYGAIKHIRLMDGRQVIDEMRFANRYLSFTNLLNENAYNRDYLNKLSKNQIGYDIDTDLQIVSGGNRSANMKTDSEVIDANGSKNTLGSLDLRKCLPILNKMNVLDTELMPNLKIEIEWESDRRNLIVNNANADAVKVEPLLVADELSDPALQDANRKALSNVVWNAIEHDQTQIPDNKTAAGALGDGATVVQKIDRKINGFDGKLVSRVLISKAFSDKAKNVTGTSINGVGDMGSKVMLLEEVNMSINGKPKLPQNLGGKNPASKLRMLTETFGNLNIAPFDNLQSVGLDKKDGAAANLTGCRPNKTANIHNDIVGNLDFIGFTVADRINDLQLNYSRTNVKDTEDPEIYNEGLDVHIYCEVSRALIVDKPKNKYMVRYN